MDATVDDFLKEINEIVPPKQKTSENGKLLMSDFLKVYVHFYNLYLSMERMLR